MYGLNKWKDLYASNEDFRDYVDRCMKNRDVTLEAVLSHKLTQIVGEMYMEKAGEKNA